MIAADMALYESKCAGRGRASAYESEMQSAKRHMRYLERELRAATYLGELELHYQPIVHADGSFCAMEALVRWRHPLRGLISPGEFIPVAERSSLIDAVGRWVFRRACLDLHEHPGCRININVSGEQLKRDEVVSMFAQVLRETGRSADRFVIEITESVATGGNADVMRRLEALRDMGFGVALDDFGTGHCGFNYLQMLPVDTIKIDRSYIRDLGNGNVADIFVSALSQIARLRDMTIVAEGIETAREFDLARAAGCSRFQGYYFGKPGPVRPRLSTASETRSDEPAALIA